jgi:hypothetical protein
MPDFGNMPLNDAISLLNSLGVKYECVGSGDTVLRQFPNGGVDYYENTLVYLYLMTAGEESNPATDAPSDKESEPGAGAEAEQQ